MTVTINEEEAAKIFRLAQRGDEDGLRTTIEKIAARELVSEGEVLVRARDAHGSTALHGAATLGNTSTSIIMPAYTHLAYALYLSVSTLSPVARPVS